MQSATQRFKAFQQRCFKGGQAGIIQGPKPFAQRRQQGFRRQFRRGRGGHFGIIPNNPKLFPLAAGFGAARHFLDQAASTARVGFDLVAIMAIAALIRAAQQDAAIELDDEFMV